MFIEIKLLAFCDTHQILIMLLYSGHILLIVFLLFKTKFILYMLISVVYIKIYLYGIMFVCVGHVPVLESCMFLIVNDGNQK